VVDPSIRQRRVGALMRSSLPDLCFGITSERLGVSLQNPMSRTQSPGLRDRGFLSLFVYRGVPNQTASAALVSWSPRARQTALWQVSTAGSSPRRSGRFQNKCGMKLQGMNPRLRELVALVVLAAFGCGLALSQGDLLFVAIFGAACAVTIIEAIRVCGER
jgi:hypothetical protein